MDSESLIEVVEPATYLLTPVEHLLVYPQMIELAARNCYKSEKFITPDSARTFLKKLLTVSKHESVFEHCSIMYRLICSRACSHQWVRHRIQGISQESMRYCDYTNENRFGKLKVILPPSFKNNDQTKLFLESCETSYRQYELARANKIPAEDARFLLPHATKTELVVSMNIRSWRHVIEERGLNPHAQWEVRGLAKAILYELNNYLPVFFEDLVEKLGAQTSNG